MTFEAWKIKFLKTMTFQLFHDPYEPCYFSLLKFVYLLVSSSSAFVNHPTLKVNIRQYTVDKILNAINYKSVVL